MPNTESATQAVGALLDHGVKAEDLSILVKSVPTNDTDTATEIRHQAESGITVTTGDDAKAGALKGAGLGLGLGTVAAVASVAIPGFGLVLGGGALATAIAGAVGATAAGAMAGAVAGYLVDQGIEPEHVDSLTKMIEAGGALVSVSIPSGNVGAAEVLAVVEKYGGTVQQVRPRTIPSPEVTSHAS